MAIGKPVIRGNFLKPTGNHWDALVAALVPEHLPAAQPPVAPRPPRQSSRPLRPTRPHPHQRRPQIADRVAARLRHRGRGRGPTSVRLHDVVLELPDAVLSGARAAGRKWINTTIKAHLQPQLLARAEHELRGVAGVRVEAPATRSGSSAARTRSGRSPARLRRSRARRWRVRSWRAARARPRSPRDSRAGANRERSCARSRAANSPGVSSRSTSMTSALTSGSTVAGRRSPTSLQRARRSSAEGGSPATTSRAGR